jgi:O-acetylhomoserine (thiol)-lyase
MNGFSSKAIHGALLKKDVHGALRFPLYDNAAFEVGNSRDLELALEGKKPGHAYSRITNPTVEDFEQRVRLLSNAFGVVAVSSGMAAITETTMALAETGSNIITSPFLFGNTVSLFETTFARWGLEVRHADMTEASSLESVIDGRTRFIFLEVITNPQLQIADVSRIADIAAGHNVPVVLDGTLTTPYLFRSRDAGVAVEIISSTKYMSGGATSIGGVIIDNGIFDWQKTPALFVEAEKVGPGALIMRLCREIHRNVGSCLSPHNAWLQSLGLETLSLRIDKSSANAMAVAHFLKTQKRVLTVNYPGLKSSRYHDIANRQFNGKFSGLLTFELNSKDECFRFMDNLVMIRRATNINDNKSLILHPASTIFVDYPAPQREQMQVNERLLRLSVGIEDLEDIITDIQQGLDKL